MENINKQEVVYSVLGESSVVIPKIWDNKSKILCISNGDEINLCIYNTGETQIVYSEILEKEGVDVGITCKTWGEKGIRKISSRLYMGENIRE